MQACAQALPAKPHGFERRAYDADRVRPRRTQFVFADAIPRYWLNGNPARTHLMNAMHLFLPPFERMLTQAVRRGALPALTDPALIRQAKGYMGQETTHGRCHELFVDHLRAQGYSVDRYLALLDWLFCDLLQKRLGAQLGVSLVAAFEHHANLFVPLAFSSDFLDGCEPAVRELLEWHLAEEVEHNAVAFDILQAVAPGQALRMAGNLLALGVLYGSLVVGALLLLWQDRQLLQRSVWLELWRFFAGKYRIVQNAARLFVEYARPGYRPDPAHYSRLAQAVLNPEA